MFDLAQQHLKVPDENLIVPLVSSTSSSGSVEVRLIVRPATIPPRSEFEVLAETAENVADGKAWLMEEKPKFW